MGCPPAHHNPSPKSSFLSLPQPVRQHIYLEAGLAVDGDIDFNWRIRQKGWRADNILRPKYALTHNILLTCRVIYAEASVLVYSTNRFFIRYRDRRSLEALINLTKTSLACITHLTVHLNVTSCDPDPIRLCRVASHRGTRCYCPEHDKPLGTSVQDSAALFQWQSTADYLATHIKPFSLKLYFVCDVENVEIGRLAVQSLRTIPTLADCSIRLNQMHHPLLQALAVETAARVKGLQYPPTECSSPFRFLDLPRELRLQILEYTDLVTPIKEVEWNPKDNFYLHYDDLLCWARKYGQCPPWRHYACKYHDCWDIDSPEVGCFCHRYHAGFSSKCHCWIPPTPLFLVCHTIQQDAQTVFFTQNHFIIAPAAGCTHPAESSPDILEASIFFKDVVPSTALRFLRSLEIVFPPFRDDYLRPHEPAYRQWLQLIEHMCQLNLPMLSLSVVMADPPDRFGPNQFRGNMTKEEAVKIFEMYRRTLKPLSKLRENGLRAFFPILASPYTWSCPRLEYRQAINDQILRHTRRIERAVMGKDYNSSLLQAKAHGHSQWLVGKLTREGSY